jgi:hypothetical protein
MDRWCKNNIRDKLCILLHGLVLLDVMIDTYGIFWPVTIAVCWSAHVAFGILATDWTIGVQSLTGLLEIHHSPERHVVPAAAAAVVVIVIVVIIILLYMAV